jgi:hypothetical protein
MHCPSCQRTETLHDWICQSCFWNCHDTCYIDCADTVAYEILFTKDWRSKEIRAIVESVSKGDED